MSSTIAAPPQERTRVRSGLVLVALALSTFAFVTVETMPIGLLTWMAPSLRVAPSTIGWLVTGYGLVVAATSVPLARWTLRFPRRPLMLWVFGLFSLSVLATAAAPSYLLVLVSRVATALLHAVFWSIVAPTAAALFSGASRAKVVPVLLSGSSLGEVIGVPAATWVGLHHGWRLAFLMAGLLAAALSLALGLLLPVMTRGEDSAAEGSEPDRRQFAVLLAVCGLSFGSIFVFQTYVTLFLERVTHFAASSLGPILLVGGVGGTLGVLLGGWWVVRSSYHALLVPLLSAAVALGCLLVWPSRPMAVLTVLLLAVDLSVVATAVQVRVFVVAPGSTDVASAGSSSMFNVGIAGGALVGGLLVSGPGVRWVPFAGALLALVGVAVMLGPGRSKHWTSAAAR